MSTIPSPTGRILVWLLFISVLLPLRVLADGADNFDDNSKDSSKWGADTALALGVLNEQNQHLEFTCSSSLSDGDTLRPWKLESFPVSGSWTVQVDTVNSTIPGFFGQVNSGGFTLLHPTDATSQIYVELYAVPGGKGFVGNLETADANVGNADTGTLVGDVTVFGAVRMEYNGVTKVATCYYDADTTDGYQWTTFASYGLAGSGGTTTNTNWGLSSNQQFAVWLYGYSAGMTVTNGQLYLDNFSETGGAIPTGGPAPVPTGNWQFAFPTNNPLLIAIASITGHYTGVCQIETNRSYGVDVAQDESGKVMAMGTLDGVADADGSSNLSGSAGAVKTVNNKPTLELKSSFTGTMDAAPVTLKSAATAPLEPIDVGGGTNGVGGAAGISGKLAGIPFSRPGLPLAIPATPDMENNLSKSWRLQLDIQTKTINGKEVTVATAQLVLPNGDTLVYPEKKVKYSASKGYKLSFKKGTNTTVIPNRIDKKSKIGIQGMTFVKVGDDWQPTAGTISYQFLGQKGTANLMDFVAP